MTAPFSLRPTDRDRLSKLAGMLGSSHDGERAVAAVKSTKLLAGLGMTWPQLIALLPVRADAAVHFMTGTMNGQPAPCDILRPWQRQAKFALGACPRHLIDEREMDFLRSMAERINTPTPKQAKWLNDIWSRGDRAAAA